MKQSLREIGMNSAVDLFSTFAGRASDLQAVARRREDQPRSQPAAAVPRRPRAEPLSERRDLLRHARLRAPLPGRALRRLAGDDERAARRHPARTGTIVCMRRRWCSASCCSRSCASRAGGAAPVKHDVVVDGHHLAVWEKRAGAAARGDPAAARADVEQPPELRPAGAGRAAVVHGRARRRRARRLRARPARLRRDAARRERVADARTAPSPTWTAVLAWMQQRGSGRRSGCRSISSACRAARWSRRWPRSSGPKRWPASSCSDSASIPTSRSRVATRRRVRRGSRNTADDAASDFITKDAYTQATVTTFVREALRADPILVDWRDDNQFNAFRPAQLQVPVAAGARRPRSAGADGGRDEAVHAVRHARQSVGDAARRRPRRAPGEIHGELVRTIVWFIAAP